MRPRAPGLAHTSWTAWISLRFDDHDYEDQLLDRDANPDRTLCWRPSGLSSCVERSALSGLYFIVDVMSDIQSGQPQDASVTVGQLQVQLDQIQTAMSTAAATAAELQAWSKTLPRRHVPPTDEVLVTDLMQVTNPDPAALQRQAGDVEDLALQVAAAIARLRATAIADTGPCAESLRQTTP